MADESVENDIKMLKNSKVVVNVEEALEDLIIVSFTHQSKVFQGALLNSTKKGLPCGITPPKEFLQPPPSSSVLGSPRPEDPPLSPSSISQRYTYFQDIGKGNKSPLIHIHRRPIKPPSRYRKPNSKMTVRLRPRQVLCSKCRSICTENSENVDVTTRSTRRNPSPENKNRKILNTSTAEGDSNKTDTFEDNKKLNKIKIVGNYWISPTRDDDSNKNSDVEEIEKPINKKRSSLEEIEKNSENDEILGKENSELMEDQERMVLRKKRSVGSMEDLWDESVFEDQKKTKLELTEPRTTTPVIKISFGTSGQVLKIPAKVTEEENNITNTSNLNINGNKAAKKALKKAKKETRRKMLGSPTSNLDIPRRHKKHRKKHKESKHRDDSEERWNVAKNDEETDYSAIKEQCLKQRLSISLKRLNATAYKSTQNDESTTSTSCSPDSSSEEVPDFPPSAISSTLSDRSSTESNSGLMMKISTQSVQTCTTADGRKMNVGDVVWGKIHGFPWWPGKVLSISVSRKDDGVCLAPHAHVAWYGSSTSSLMPCDQLCPFLETFKTRYNKKKRGPYKEAIRQATTEAQSVCAANTSSPSHQILSVNSSPREVNVLS